MHPNAAFPPQGHSQNHIHKITKFEDHHLLRFRGNPHFGPPMGCPGMSQEIPGDGRSWPLEVKEKRRVQATGEGWKSLELGPSAKQHETCGTR